MYIQPHTNIRLLRGCPCDPQYIHSLFFASASNQTSYFLGLTKYNLNAYSYQRYAKGILRVQILADNLYDVNYMMFQNTAFGNKWFYAFVDNVEYINDVTTEIRYHIDEIQTWLFNWEFNDCFIERQHTETDEVGDNIVVEPLEVGEYVYNDYSPMIDYRERAIVVAVADVNSDYEYVADGQMYDGIYGGCNLFAYSADTNGVQGINKMINKYAKSPDSIVGIYMIPAYLVQSHINGNVEADNASKLPYGTTGVAQTKSLGTCGQDIDGYEVRNNKLFTYPYNFMNISNGDGATLSLRYEFFKDKTAMVKILGNVCQPIQLVCFPTDYKNVNKAGELGDYPALVDEKIALTSYPMCSWSIDAWKAWVTQNATPIMVSALTAGATMALAAYNPAVTSEVGTGVTSAITGKELMETKTTPASFTLKENSSIFGLHSVSNLLTSAYKASIAADISKGNISSSTTAFANGEYTFHYGRMSVNKLQAEIIDSFFDRYGYAIHKVGKPSIHTRGAWTYLKTIDCTINGNIPSDSEHEIEQIFNNGITFWTNPLHVGDYSQNNEPITQP